MAIMLQELKGAIGFHKQSALQTALVAASCWSLGQSNRAIGQAVPVNQDNAQDLNKGDEFPTQLFKSHLQSTYPWDYFLSSENAAMVAAFGLGHVEKAAAGTGFKYTCTPLDPITEDIEMPATTAVQQLRDGFDQALIGMCCNEFTISLQSGPGRENATMRSQWIGCGKYAEPSGIVIPAAATEHLLNAGGATTITILGQAYITLKSFVSCDFGWRNNIIQGFYPGSGSQSGHQIAGRMRHGNREALFSLVAELATNSPEFAAAKALTEGTAVIDVVGAQIGAGPATHEMKATFQRLTFSAVQIGESNGVATVVITGTPLKHTVNGVLTIEVTCEQDEICEEAGA